MDWYMVLIIGLGMVFAVLALLWGILEIFRLLFYKKATAEKQAEDDSEIFQTVEKSSENGDESELIAVLAAAISAYSEKPLSSFKVVSFKQIEQRK